MNPITIRRSACVGFVLALCAGATVLAEPPGLHEIARFDLAGGGDSGALQLDASGKRLYAARGATLTLLNWETGAKLASLQLNSAIEGLALAPDAKRAFATTADGHLAILATDPLSITSTASIPGSGAKSIAYDPDTNRVFVGDANSGDVAVFDAGTGRLAADLPLGGKITGVACDGFSRVFAAAQAQSLIHVIDSHALKSLGDYPTTPGVNPTGIALEDEGRRLFVPCLNGKLVVLDNDVGAAFRILPTFGKGPACVAFGLADPDAPVGDPPWKGRIVAITEDGTVNVGKMLAFVNYAAHDHFSLGARPLGVAIDGPTQRAYILLAASASSSQVVAFEPTNCSASK